MLSNKKGLTLVKTLIVLTAVVGILGTIGILILDKSIFFSSIVLSRYHDILKHENARELGKYLILYENQINRRDPFVLREQEKKQTLGFLPYLVDGCGEFSFNNIYKANVKTDELCLQILRMMDYTPFDFDLTMISSLAKAKLASSKGNQISFGIINLSHVFEKREDQQFSFENILVREEDQQSFMNSEVELEITLNKSVFSFGHKKNPLLNYKILLNDKKTGQNLLKSSRTKKILRNSLAISNLKIEDFAIFMPFPVNKNIDNRIFNSCIVDDFKEDKKTKCGEVKGCNRLLDTSCNGTTKFKESINLNKFDKIYGKVFFNGDIDVRSLKEFEDLPIFYEQVIITGDIWIKLPPTSKRVAFVKKHFKKGIITRFPVGDFLDNTNLLKLLNIKKNACQKRIVKIKDNSIEVTYLNKENDQLFRGNCSGIIDQQFLKDSSMEISVEGKQAFIMSPFIKLNIERSANIYGTLLGGSIIKKRTTDKINIYPLKVSDSSINVIKNERYRSRGYYSYPILMMPKLFIEQ